MATIFVSHSREDSEGRLYFDKLFASSHHKLYWYSWEGPRPPHALTLRKAIAQSASVFVVLSPEMDKPQTRSWVGYEVGIASGLNKNVWVFEKAGAWTQPVDVPVPFVSGYVQRFEQLPARQIFPFAQLADGAGISIPGRWPLTPAQNAPFSSTDDPASNAERRDVECPYPDCRAAYAAYLYQTGFNCPVCRRQITFTEGENQTTGRWG